MAKSKAHVGDTVSISFLDHATITRVGDLLADEDMGPAECRVFGVLIEDNKSHYVVGTWVSAGNELDDDSDLAIIVKHPGMKVSVLKRGMKQ